MLERFDALFGEVSAHFNRESQLIFNFLLCYQAEKGIRGDLLEVGVAKGKCAGMLGLHAREDECLHLVDIRDRYSDTVARTGARIASYRVSSHDMDFVDGLAKGQFRFIHIDARHDASFVARELDFARRHVTQKGLIVVDDFFNEAYPQVTVATLDFLARHRHELFLLGVGFNKAYLARPMAALPLFRRCYDHLQTQLRSQGAKHFTVTRSARWPETGCLGFTLDERKDLPKWLDVGGSG